MTIYIRPQWYPMHNGSLPRSYAVWLKRSWRHKREFCCYAFEFSRAWQAAALIAVTYSDGV